MCMNDLFQLRAVAIKGQKKRKKVRFWEASWCWGWVQSPNEVIPIHKIEKTLDVSSIIYARNCRFSDSGATRFSSHRKRDATGDSLLSGTVSHNTIRYSEVARETRSRWLSSALWDCFGGEFSTWRQIRQPKHFHNALWQPSQPDHPRNLKVANS